MSYASTLSATVELEVFVAPDIYIGGFRLTRYVDVLDLVVCPLYAITTTDGTVALVQALGFVGEVDGDGFAVAGC